jgi:signal transduction histidine kinase
MLALSLAYIVFGRGGEGSSGGAPIAGIILAVVAGSLATTTVLVTVEVEPRPAQQRARRLLGAALFLWTLAEGYRAVIWAVEGAAPAVPSITELLRLAGYMSMLAAAVAYSAPGGGRYGGLRQLLDTAILVIAGTALAWLVIIRPASMALAAGGVSLAWSSVAPVFDLVLILLAIRLQAGSVSSGEAHGFLGMSLAFVALLAGDLVRGYIALGGEIGPQTLPDGGWGIAASVIALIVPRALPREAAEIPEVPVARPLRQRMEPLLPIALTYAVVGFTILNWWLVREVDWVGVGAAAILSLLLMARQGVIGGQSEMRQFAALVNASADLAFVCQADGLVQLANPAVQDSLRTERPPATVGEFLAAPAASEVLLRQAFHGGWSGEVELRRSDGSVFPASLNLRPVWDERLGRALLVGTAHDLTRIREREDDLRAALGEVASARRELQALNADLERRVTDRTQELAETVERLHRMNLELQELGRLKSEFVTLVSHELRAPLTNIRAGIELTLASHPGFDPRAQERLALVASETDRLARFVEAILDLSALEAGRFPLRVGPTDLGQAAGLVSDRLRAHQDGDRIVLALPESTPAVMADERALESMFFHLLDNALKYAPSGEIRVVARPESSGVEVSVTDHGPGIPPEDRERVFEMFHRLDARDSREVYGHGLGLHLTRRLLEAMGGWIRAEAAEGGGTCMVFWLPGASTAP